MQAGLAGVHGNVSSFGSANGISVVALADFGKPGVGGVDGSSGATGKSSNGGSASINNDEDEIEDDDLLALLEGDENAERSPKNTDKSDMYGKTLKTAVARVQNSGSVSGSITARAQQLKRPLNKNSYTPQFYDVSLITSGNGVSMANYIETPDKYTYSQEKQNHVHLGSLDNSGNMRGQATLEGGTRTTHTYTKSKGSGNGVSLFASTGRFAKNATRVALDNVNNDGHISGQIRQISGNNSGYNSPHMMSGSEATGSGNGISLYSDTFNAQIPRVETRLGKIKIAPRVAVQPGQSVNATPNSATADPTNGADNSVTTNTATTGTTANTATNTVGSLARLNRDHDAASATFETPYADAYNSYTSAWRNTGDNPLKNSSYLPENAQAEKAVNQYLADTVAHNPYGAIPAATLAAHQDTRRELLDNHARPLRQGETYTAISGSLARNDALKTSDSKAHDNQLGIGISNGITSDLTLGITASVGREKTNGSHDSRLKGNSHYIGAHAVKTLGDLSLTGGLAYSQTSLKGTRHINNGYDAQSHAARNKPSVTSAYAEGKYTLRLNDHLAWEPKAILAYNHLKTGNVSESGSGGLTIASRGINTVDIGIGQDLTYSTKAGSGELRGKLSLDYIHTSGEKDLQARFNGSDSGFTLRTDKNPNTVRAGLTGEYQTAKGVIIRAGVSDNLRKGKNDLQGTLSVGVKF
ncbi:autotransporter outer membrane beta-barrel domain-containing protein [Cardiobacterium hominis]|uniref:autotransporter outer membrane beta-barrel domain-containing protein n=1 Tax=Cardiobacterium hominis TaxID=2718 RepID=UPI002492B433|nr:autotransporter outer membrane beta-barrel domain-containing protein [Cardiobacterium hominis]